MFQHDTKPSDRRYAAEAAPMPLFDVLYYLGKPNQHVVHRELRNMQSIKKLAAFLTSLWGVLAVASIAFPGTAALLDLPIAVENSKISDLYPIVGIICSAFCLLMLIVYQTDLSSLEIARKVSLFTAPAAFILFFAFVLLKTVYLDIQVADNRTPPTDGTVTITHRSLGLLKIETYINGELVRIEERGDPLDVLSLAFFAGTFASFTLCFGALGIHTYEMRTKGESGTA